MGGGRDKHSVAIAFIVQGLSLYGETRERVCFARDDVCFFPKTLRVEGSRLGFFYIGTSGRMSRAPGGVPKKGVSKMGRFLKISGGGRSGLCIGFYS